MAWSIKMPCRALSGLKNFGLIFENLNYRFLTQPRKQAEFAYERSSTMVQKYICYNFKIHQKNPPQSSDRRRCEGN